MSPKRRTESDKKSTQSGWRWGVAVGAGAGVGAVAVVGAGVAIASIPSGNTISGCRNTSTKALKIIDKDLGQNCAAGETALNWTTWKAKGAWLASTLYQAGDVVTDYGDTYVAKVKVPIATANRPPNATYWTKISNGVNSATATHHAVVPDDPSPGVPAPIAFLDATAPPTLTVRANEMIQVVSSAVLGSTNTVGPIAPGPPAEATISLCYANITGGGLQTIAGPQIVTIVNGTQRVQLDGFTPPLAAGTYRFGLCGTKTVNAASTFDTDGNVTTYGQVPF
jgi:hypothetical protein